MKWKTKGEVRKQGEENIKNMMRSGVEIIDGVEYVIGDKVDYSKPRETYEGKPKHDQAHALLKEAYEAIVKEELFHNKNKV